MEGTIAQRSGSGHCTTAESLAAGESDSDASPALAALEKPNTSKLQPLFHRMLHVNLAPSAFDEEASSPWPTPQHASMCSPTTDRSNTTSTSSSSKLSANASKPPAATAATPARDEAAAPEQGLHLVQHQAVQLSPAPRKSSIDSTASLDTANSSRTDSVPVQLQPCRAPGDSEPLPVVDLAADLVILADDPLLSTGACLPAVTKSPTTPSTPQMPNSFINPSRTAPSSPSCARSKTPGHHTPSAPPSSTHTEAATGHTPHASSQAFVTELCSSPCGHVGSAADANSARCNALSLIHI